MRLPRLFTSRVRRRLLVCLLLALGIGAFVWVRTLQTPESRSTLIRRSRFVARVAVAWHMGWDDDRSARFVPAGCKATYKYDTKTGLFRRAWPPGNSTFWPFTERQIDASGYPADGYYDYSGLHYLPGFTPQHLPAGGEVVAAEPEDMYQGAGKRVAMLATWDTTQPADNHSASTKREKIIGLWICDSHGGHDRLIGTAPWPPYEEPVPDNVSIDADLGSYISWVPGTNDVSFVYRGGLYRVNVGAP